MKKIIMLSLFVLLATNSVCDASEIRLIPSQDSEENIPLPTCMLNKMQALGNYTLTVARYKGQTVFGLKTKLTNVYDVDCKHICSFGHETVKFFDTCDQTLSEFLTPKPNFID